MRHLFRLLLAATLLAGVTFAQLDDNRQFPAFRIIGNLYYVGTNEVACFLITTPMGHILINSGYENTPALIVASVEQLGFRVESIRYMVSSHAHMAQVAGQAVMQEMTGARVGASELDAAVIRRGGYGDFFWEGNQVYPPVAVSFTVKDGEEFTVGGTTLTAHLTPGHTKGCTTWTLKVKDHGKLYDVVIVGGALPYGAVKLLGNAKYPNIVVDCLRTFQVLRSLPCDVFLSAQGSEFGLAEKYARMKKDRSTNPFIDPDGYKAFVDTSEKMFQRRLAAEQ